MPVANSGQNPFTPSFGVPPPHLAGRGAILQSIREAMAAGPRHPGFTSLLLGGRGTGKTTILMQTEKALGEAGWVVCRTDALLPGADRPVCEAITLRAQSLLEQHSKARRRLTGAHLDVAGLVSAGADWEHQGPAPLAARSMQTALMELSAAVEAKKGKVGVLLLLDEFHNVRAADASIIASAVQNAKIEGRRLGFIGAGLAHVERTLLPNRGFTFFQRCARHKAELLDLSESMQALQIPLQDHNIEISSELLLRAATATSGHPYAIQSLGFHLWARANPTKQVNESALVYAINEMSQNFQDCIVVPIWHQLSPRKRQFLIAMSYDDGPSRIANIIRRIESNKNAVNSLRRQLIDEGVIAPSGHGYVEFFRSQVKDIATEHQHELEIGRFKDE